MLYQSLSFLNNFITPRFPRPPVKSYQMRSMPSDLIANGRNFYTEIIFVDFRSGIYGANGSGLLQSISGGIGSAIGGLVGAGIGLSTGNTASAAAGVATGNQIGKDFLKTAALAAIRLPIPTNVNDQMTFNWDPVSATSLIPMSPLARSASQGAGFLIGKTLNPLLFAAFNRPNFREFVFDWVLAPRNEDESETIRLITQTFKHAASPGAGIPLMDYPYVAMVRMYPNDLNGHAIFKPMVVKSIGVNLTPNPTPSFFESKRGRGGAPTIVSLRVTMMEIKIWTREDVVV